MNITNISIIIYIIVGLGGIIGFIAGVTTMSWHNIIIGAGLFFVARTGYIITKRENSF